MKYATILIFIFCLCCPFIAGAEDFLGAPVIAGGENIEKTNSRFEFKTSLTHDEALAYYKKGLKELENIKYRDWKDSTYIEDDGNRKWHSITISKEYEKGTTVVIVKDNWTWIIGTLILRYIGVFVVLMILFVGMSVSGKIISRTVGKAQTGKA